MNVKDSLATGLVRDVTHLGRDVIIFGDIITLFLSRMCSRIYVTFFV